MPLSVAAFLEGGEINLVHGAFIHLGIHAVAVEFLIVGGKVFNDRHGALRAASLDPVDGHDGGQIRVFAEILEVAAVHGHAADVETGTELKVRSPGAVFETHSLAKRGSHLCIKGRRQGRAGGEGARSLRAIRRVANAAWTIGHREDRDSQPLNGVGHEARPADKRDFLLQCHLGDQLIRPFVRCAFSVLGLENRGRGSGGVLGLNWHGAWKNGKDGESGKASEFHKAGCSPIAEIFAILKSPKNFSEMRETFEETGNQTGPGVIQRPTQPISIRVGSLSRASGRDHQDRA